VINLCDSCPTNGPYDDDINALVVWDGTPQLHIPEQCGKPRGDQMIGTPAERLTELAGRICYDSLGTPKSRNSKDYHKHILEVGHLSVYEHFNFSVSLDYIQSNDLLTLLLNRPGVFCTINKPGTPVVTLNLRSVLEWDARTEYLAREAYGSGQSSFFVRESKMMGNVMRYWANQLAPQVVEPPTVDDRRNLNLTSKLVLPKKQDQMWISVYMSGSRGFSHEQVRHGDQTAISQRSTRYCDESESNWATHPLITKYNSFAATSLNHKDEDNLKKLSAQATLAVDSSKTVYNTMSDVLASFLTQHGSDAGTARKQARGAARGYLGNAIATSMIFSASVSQWRRMIAQRGHPAADAEIRLVYSRLLPKLQASAYSREFSDLYLVPSQDGLGHDIQKRS